MKNYVKKTINERGSIFYYNKKGQFHRIDGPAIIWSNGDKCWYNNGKYHREDGPAFEFNSGNKFWVIDGEMCEGEEEFLYLTKYKEDYQFSI